MDVKQITLATMADGAADELFSDALSKVLANIEDPNTDAREKRTITLRFEFTADEERNVGSMKVVPTIKLAGTKGLKVGLYLGRHEGLPVAVEAPRQPDMFPSSPSKLRAVAPPQGS